MEIASISTSPNWKALVDSHGKQMVILSTDKQHITITMLMLQKNGKEGLGNEICMN